MTHSVSTVWKGVHNNFTIEKLTKLKWCFHELQSGILVACNVDIMLVTETFL